LKENYIDTGVRSIVKLVLILFDETKKCITDIIFIIYDLNEKDPADEKLLKESFEKNIRNRNNEGEEKSIKKFLLSEFEKLIKQLKIVYAEDEII
jgi:hypothetical protein